MPHLQIGQTQLELHQGDITQVVVDAIVNAANAQLAGGGGVDGAIHRAGGPSIMAECRQIGGCPTGSAVRTGAGRLPARYVIHAVAPVYHAQARDAVLLRGAYAASLRLADEGGSRSIAFPSLGTGVYGYPIAEAAPIAVETVVAHIRAGSGLTRVIFVLHSAGDYAVYERVLAAQASPG
ncbi:MAG TPA: O-acetyl-ADP-ribose deacetylase [Chloroflexia bacterium]|nr:O-acetyl-ADP-ribose deacetylase [Chloroflexia bacterium]